MSASTRRSTRQTLQGPSLLAGVPASAGRWSRCSISRAGTACSPFGRFGSSYPGRMAFDEGILQQASNDRPQAELWLIDSTAQRDHCGNLSSCAVFRIFPAMPTRPS